MAEESINKKKRKAFDIDQNKQLDSDDDVESPATETAGDKSQSDTENSGDDRRFGEILTDIKLEEAIFRYQTTYGEFAYQFPDKGDKLKNTIINLQKEKDLRERNRPMKAKALEAAINDINNSFGNGSVTRLGSADGALVEKFPSGCLSLDIALDGGLPRGRIVEIYGPENSGKTTLALHAIAEVQKLGGNAMLVDAEHTFDPTYSKGLGVDLENLIVCQPDNGEMALEIADRMCRSGAIDLICVDSVSALTPQAEIQGEIGMQQMGLQRLMSQALRKMSVNALKAGCTVIFLNQIRHKVGVYYGNPEVTSGGIGLKFFASVRLEMRATGKIKSVKGDEDIGVKVCVRVQKSKVSRPYTQAEFEIIFGEGISKLGCVLDCAEMMDIVLKKGSCYSFKDQSLGQGRDKALQHLKENPVLSTTIEKNIRWETTDGKQIGSFNSRFLPLQPQEKDMDEECQ